MQTFKQKVAENPSKYLSLKDDVYISRKNYTWGKVDAYSIRWESIHEVYDLTTQKYFYKIATPFEHNMSGINNEAIHTTFKSTYDNKDYDLCRLIRTLKNRDDLVLFRLSYPNKYGILNNLLMIIDSDEWDDLSELQREHYITINAYINLVLRKNKHRSWHDIDSAPPLTGKALNWVWFRKPGYKLSDTILNNMNSWIQFNPELTFNLWTDISDEDELNDFISNVKDEWPHNTIQVKYLSDTLSFIKTYFETYTYELSQIPDFDTESFYENVAERVYNRTLIAKTDFLRAMILHYYGGFYTDMNDCECFIPMRYWFRDLVTSKQELILPCDTFTEAQISNYFMYVPKGSKQFERLHLKTLPGFKGIHKCFIDPTTPKKIADIYIPYAKKFLRKLKQTETYEPTQLISDLMFPVYESQKFQDAITDAVTAIGLVGLGRCDIRPKMFFPMFILKYLAEKHECKQLKDFFQYMADEFRQIATIRLYRPPIRINQRGQVDTQMPPQPSSNTNQNKIEVVHIKQSHVEDWEGLDALLKVYDQIIQWFDELETDTVFHEYIHKEFVRNMVFVAVNMTNIMLHVEKELTMQELIPFCFVYLNMTYLTMIGHYGHGTSIGIDT